MRISSMVVGVVVMVVLVMLIDDSFPEVNLMVNSALVLSVGASGDVTSRVASLSSLSGSSMM